MTEKPGLSEDAKRKFDQAFPLMTAPAERQKAWLKRGDSKDDSHSWRPTPVHRVSVKNWLHNMDNQMACTMGRSGLKYFLKDEKDPDWQDWRKWHVAIVPMDLGPDGVSAMHALQFWWKACVEIFPDPAHGADCDTERWDHSNRVCVRRL